MKKIKILPNGPLEIKGFKTLFKETIKPINGGVLGLSKTDEIETNDTFYLCRCGASQGKPFCDGAHEKIQFDGTENANTEPYLQRAYLQQGEGVSLLDDNRCAFARFCHRQRGSVWELVDGSSDEENKKEAIEGANACPTGRLTAVLNGKLVEEEFEDEISVVDDPIKRVSSGIFIRGDFELQSATGKFYEKRNRTALCRCGASKNKPFCDATHVVVKFNDKE